MLLGKCWHQLFVEESSQFVIYQQWKALKRLSCFFPVINSYALFRQSSSLQRHRMALSETGICVKRFKREDIEEFNSKT